MGKGKLKKNLKNNSCTINLCEMDKKQQGRISSKDIKYIQNEEGSYDADKQSVIFPLEIEWYE
jgi:hypothetical protein